MRHDQRSRFVHSSSLGWRKMVFKLASQKKVRVDLGRQKKVRVDLGKLRHLPAKGLYTLAMFSPLGNTFASFSPSCVVARNS